MVQVMASGRHLISFGGGGGTLSRCWSKMRQFLCPLQKWLYKCTSMHMVDAREEVGR